MSPLVRRLRRWIAIGAAALVITLALLVGLFRVLAPQLPEHRAQIEAWAGDAIGLPVSVGRLDARWHLHGPELLFFDARILSADRSTVLIRAASGSIGLNLWRLAAHRELVPGRVGLTGARIALARDADDHLGILGQDRRPTRDWSLAALPQGVLELRDAEFSYQGTGGGNPWRFAHVDVHAERGRGRTHAEGRLALPATLGGGLTFAVDRIDGDPSAPVELFAEGTDLVLQGWAELLPASLPLPQAGQGDLAVWAGLQGGSLERLSVNVELAGVAPPKAAPPAGDEAFVFDRIAGRFDWDRNADGWVARATRLELERGGSHWPETDLSLQAARAGGQESPSLHAEGSFLRVEDVLPVVAAFVDHPQVARIAAFEPRGVLRNFVIDYAGGPQPAPSYRVRGSIAGAAVREAEGLPGLAGIGGTIDATESGGRAELASDSLDFTLERLFRNTLHADDARGTVIWRRSRAGWRIVSDAIELHNEDLHARSSFEIGLPGAGGAADVDLDVDVIDGRLEHLGRYLPVGILRPNVAAWLERAVTAGRVKSGRVELEGSLGAFPFDDGGGALSAHFAVADVAVDYAPGWPAVEALDGDIEFANTAVHGQARSGDLLGNRVKAARVSFADIRNGRLHVEGQTEGPLGQVEAFISASPLESALGAFTSRVDVRDGQAQVDVDLDLPIGHLQERRVDATLALQGADLGVTDVDAHFADLNGDFHIVDGALAGGQARARLFGKPVELEVLPGDAADSRAVAVLTGRIDARDLDGHLHLPLAGRLQGETGWRATARLRVREPDREMPLVLHLESALEGLAVDLPAPFAKPADEARLLSVDFRFPESDRLDVSGTWGGLLRTRVHLTKPADEWALLAGAARLGDGALTLPPSGFSIEGSLPALRLDDWLALRAPGGGAGGLSVFKTLRLELGDLYAFGQRVPGPVTVNAERNASEWLLQIESGNVAGAIFLPLDLQGDAPVLMRMERLLLVDADPQAEPGRPPPDPRRLPAMDVHADEFAHGVRRVGALEAELARTAEGLTLTRLETAAPSFTASATGNWTASDSGQRSTIALELKSENVGETLTALGFGDAIEAQAGDATFDLRWPGAPTGDFLEHLSGTASVHLTDGQVDDVEPGAGRVFGLLSLSALPRRMGLDFRDVFNKGLAFDSIQGDFAIEDGHAYTSNLLLEGPAADIGIVGRAGLAARDYDQTAIVSANIGRSLPIAGLLAGGPPVAAAMLLFSEIFKKPLKGMTQIYYHVDGSWDDPQVERVAATQAPDEQAGGSP